MITSEIKIYNEELTRNTGREKWCFVENMFGGLSPKTRLTGVEMELIRWHVLSGRCDRGEYEGF